MIKEKLQALRQLLQQHNYSGYIIPSNDEYMSEYTPDYAKRLEYITGFTGSNGIAIILPQTTLFFTDGRYLTQSKQQLDPNLFEVYNIAELFSFRWDKYVSQNQVIAFDPKLFNKHYINNLHSLHLIADERNFVDLIWNDQPARPQSQIFEYEEKYAGQAFEDKINLCRNLLKEHQSEALLICDSASICWLLNIRANDVDFCPILLCHLLIKKSEIYLFTDGQRDISKIHRKVISLFEINELPQIISNIEGKILFDDNQTSMFLHNILNRLNSKHITNPCMLWKACKNLVEIEWAKKRHIQDAIAVCEALAFIENNDLSTITEYEIGQLLTDYRKLRDGYILDSFPSICGYQDNGAVIHYRASLKNSKTLSGSGLLLIDSGGHYMGSTTDITRVVLIGQNKTEYIEYYTRVLKGHIALASVKFPKNKVIGAHLDVLARKYLWELGEDYAHGTGHGVGNFLSVHEGPQNISLALSKIPLMPGMILSNEPGYYKEGQFGIRIENLMHVIELSNNILSFETLTLVPYAKNLINFAMLSTDEIAFLKNYYAQIHNNIAHLLSKQASLWLDSQLNF
ncbi:MAG: aminopeptidase P family protein [Rickettsiaceae bacterium]|nr:aminopeptidase P family protein [Rickettsiaceae bacterium]